jgi:hypothetical protein
VSDDRARLEAELARIEQAIAAQEGLRGILPDDQLEATLAALREKQASMQAQLTGSGAIALGPGAVAAGAGGVAAGAQQFARRHPFRASFAPSAEQVLLLRCGIRWSSETCFAPVSVQRRKVLLLHIVSAGVAKLVSRLSPSSAGQVLLLHIVSAGVAKLVSRLSPSSAEQVLLLRRGIRRSSETCFAPVSVRCRTSSASPPWYPPE